MCLGMKVSESVRGLKALGHFFERESVHGPNFVCLSVKCTSFNKFVKAFLVMSVLGDVFWVRMRWFKYDELQVC